MASYYLRWTHLLTTYVQADDYVKNEDDNILGLFNKLNMFLDRLQIYQSGGGFADINGKMEDIFIRTLSQVFVAFDLVGRAMKQGRLGESFRIFMHREMLNGFM